MTDDNNNKRYGDWQKRSAREDANEILPDQSGKPWYKQTLWIILFLLVFWPVGIVLCWKSDWHLAAKIAATIIVIFCVVMVIQMQVLLAQMGY